MREKPHIMHVVVIIQASHSDFLLLQYIELSNIEGKAPHIFSSTTNQWV